MPRPRKPTAIKRLLGTYRPDRANPSEWTPPAGAPPMPPGFSAVQAKEWRRLVRLLVEAGVATVVDGEVIEAYVRAVVTARDAEAVWQRDGMVIPGSDNQPKAHPAIRIARQSWDAAHRLGASLGLDPSSRARLEVPPKEKADGIGDFLSGRARSLRVVSTSNPSPPGIPPDGA